MAPNDFLDLDNVLSTSAVARNVSNGLASPGGAPDDSIYAMNSLLAQQGVVARRFTPQAPNTNFSPLLYGGEISYAVQRAPSGGLTGWDAWIFMALQGPDVADSAYILGLANGDPCYIELRKGSLAGGLPDENVGGANKILRRSSVAVAVGTYVHIRLEHVVNSNSECTLNCWWSLSGDVTAPVWEQIPGMAPFIDDSVGINSGSLPYLSGYAGHGARFLDATRRVYFDHGKVGKQTALP